MASKITKIGTTNNKISARGGLTLTLNYFDNTNLLALILSNLDPLVRKGHKGLELYQFVRQVLAFFIDGTSRSLCHFDNLKNDQGYSAILETEPDQLASSHQIKRFFGKMAHINDDCFNEILHQLLIWRLKIERPSIIELGIDTMVMNNDQAKKRQGCECTYKKVKGFQPLNVTYGGYIVSTLFRKGSAHSNHGTDFTTQMEAVVNLIRKEYDADVPIVLRADSGFSDQKAFRYFEESLGIHYIITSKRHADYYDYINGLDDENFAEIKKGKAIWQYHEFGDRRKSWDKMRRCFYTRLQRDHQGQYKLHDPGTDAFIYTNISMGGQADQRLVQAVGHEYFQASSIIAKSHERGADELIHRSLKELATTEHLPFEAFGNNRAYYFLMVIAHFMFEAYKRDVTYDVISPVSYPNTFRRKLIDFAAMVVDHARNTILKVTKTIYQTLKINELWKRCCQPPPIAYG